MKKRINEPINSSINTSLNGIVVTPNTQQTKHADWRYPLKFLLTDDIICKFQKNTFPIIHKSKDGLFMQPTQRIITPMTDTYVKWLFIGADYKPSHDHNYPVTKIKESGYFMRISIDGRNINNLSNQEFIIDYIQDVTNVETLTLKSLTVPKPNSDDNNIVMVIKPYEIGLQNELIENIIKDKNEFFELYLKDVFNR